MEQFVFFIFTILVLGGAFGVVTSKNLYYAALFMIMSFSGMAGYFVLLNAGFLAAVQIVVYVGAIAILILFAIMLSRKVMTRNEPLLNRQWGLGLAAAAFFFFVMLAVPLNVKWPLSSDFSSGNELVQLGLAFLGSYVIPFEVVSILLLVALVGAIILARDTSDGEVK